MGYYNTLMAIYAYFSFTKISCSKNKSNRKILTFLFLLPAFILVAFRDINVGTDTITYHRGYTFLPISNGLFNVIKNARMEPGYVFLSYLFKKAGLSFYVFQFFIALFLFVMLYKFICNYSCNIGFSCFLFVATSTMFSFMNIVRMMMAGVILINSIKYIENRNFKKFFFSALFASLFHTSALIFLLLYPISIMKDKLLYKAEIIAGSIIMALFSGPLFRFITRITGMYGGYLESSYFDNENHIAVYLGLLIDLAFFILLSIYRKSYLDTSDISMDYRQLNGSLNNSKAISTEKEPISIEYITYMSIIITIGIDIIGLTNAIMGRISGYFSLLYLILIPKLMKVIKPKKTAIFIQICIMVLLYIKLLIITVYRPGWNSAVPYNFFWDTIY